MHKQIFSFDRTFESGLRRAVTSFADNGLGDTVENDDLVAELGLVILLCLHVEPKCGNADEFNNRSLVLLMVGVMTSFSDDIFCEETISGIFAEQRFYII